MIEQTPPIPMTGPGLSAPPPALHWRVNRFGERYLLEVNPETFDKLGVRLTLEEAFRGQLGAQDTLYVFAGSDSGHLIEHVKRLPPPMGTRYLFIDPPAVHAALAAESLLEDLPRHIRYAPADAWAEAAQELLFDDYLYIDNVEVVFSLAAQSPDAPDYVELAWGLQETVASLRWQTVGTRGSEDFIACQIDNAADNMQSAALWRGMMAGRTGVLLAGGPSLDAALDWVRHHRQALVVLAVSRISRRLLEVGLEPDFVLSVDPTQMSYEISRDMLRFGKSVVFINQYHVNPRLLGQWPHRSFFLGRVMPWESPLNPPDPLTGAGPTVTNTALDFAGALGLSRVVLAGVDLCFTPEGFTHAQGSNERKVGPRFDLTQLEVETNDGQRASTTADFSSAVQMLGLQAQRLRTGGMEIVNPAPGAARIPGVSHLPLDEVVVTDPPLERPLRLDGHPDTPERRLRHAQAVIRELERKLDEIGHLEGELQHARRIVDKLFHEDGTIHNRNLRKRLDRLEAEIDARHPEIVALIRQCGTHAFLRAMKTTQDLDSLDAAAVQQALRDYYGTYLDGSRRLKSLIRQGLDRAKQRVREYGDSTPLPEVARQWLTHREPGRYVRWERLHPLSIQPRDAATRQALLELQVAHEADLRQEGGQHLTRAKAHANLGAARVRLENLFVQQKAEGIRNVITGLEKASDAVAAAPYLSLARGLLAELEQRMDDALVHYDAVLQSDQQSLWPAALVRIAAWALANEHIDHARQALECLSGLSSRYRPQYGDILAATGDLGLAIDVYEQHLSEYPDDIHVMARLTRLMINAGADAAARLMIEHIERQPGGAEITPSLRLLIDSVEGKAA